MFEFSYLYLRDNRMGTRGKGKSVRVNVWDSKIEEEVGEKRPNTLCQKHLKEQEKQHFMLPLYCGAQDCHGEKNPTHSSSQLNYLCS